MATLEFLGAMFGGSADAQSIGAWLLHLAAAVWTPGRFLDLDPGR
jgi:hypothetical protein